VSEEFLDDIPVFLKRRPRPDKPKKRKRRKKKPGKKRKKGNRMVVLKQPYWSTVIIRVEHLAFLRQLKLYYKPATYGKILGALIVDEYCRVLQKTDPIKATQIRKAYKSERFKNDIIELDGRD
jgi:hypothetical protein